MIEARSRQICLPTSGRHKANKSIPEKGDGMKSSTQDKTEGRLKQAKGKIKEGAGKISGKSALENEGKIDNTAGKAQEKRGEVKEALGK